jgi:hypothetical protein
VPSVAIYLTRLPMLSLILRFYGRLFNIFTNDLINPVPSVVIYLTWLPMLPLILWLL